MKIEKDKYVKIILRNNLQVEGTVVEWTESEVTLQSLDNKNLIIIPHPNDDIVVMRVSMEIQTPIPTPKISEKPPEEIKEEISNVISSTTPSDDGWRLKHLAELRAQLASQEKKIISEKLKSHHITETNEVVYGFPGFFKKSDSQ
jgi:hypothetical protein